MATSDTVNTAQSLKPTYSEKVKEQYRIKGWQRPRGMQKRNPLQIYLEQMRRGSK